MFFDIDQLKLYLNNIILRSYKIMLWEKDIKKS